MIDIPTWDQIDGFISPETAPPASPTADDLFHMSRLENLSADKGLPVAITQTGSYPFLQNFGKVTGFSVTTGKKTVAYKMLPQDCAILADATTAAFAVTLPAASILGQIVYIIKVDSSVHTVTLTPRSSNTINGASSGSLAAQYNSQTLLSDGKGNWLKIAST